jgi:hypothetical protein
MVSRLYCQITLATQLYRTGQKPVGLKHGWAG